ncbi:hypothetical protein AN958_11981 [Leucoagaricus sp. SymC.cos]|nr:hypothetical protein AN958_11981 [Leucoagaricus sp. SymC.cos]
MGQTNSKESKRDLSVISSTPKSEGMPQNYQDSICLLSEIVADRSKRRSFATLKDDQQKAQLMADFLHRVLERDDYKQPATRKDVLTVLVILARMALVFPESLKLGDVDCNFEQDRPNETTFVKIYHGTYQKQDVCIKAIRVGVTQPREELLKVHAKEAIISVHVYHPNILPFHGVYLPEGSEVSHNVCIVSPWMKNGDLVSFLKKSSEKGSNDVNRPLLMLDIISGLKYLHGMDVIHGDLQAKNVLVSRQGRALLTDFGASRVSNASRTGSSISKPNWTALEVLNGCQPTKQSDIWSFACTYYELITRGTMPFYEYTDIAPLKDALNKGTKPEQPDGMTDDDRAVWKQIECCWHKEPDKRPNATKLYSALAKVAPHDTREERKDWDSRIRTDETDIDYDAVHEILQKFKSATPPEANGRK